MSPAPAGLWSSAFGRSDVVRILVFPFHQCLLFLASRGCSKSITLRFPKEWLLFSFLKWLWYSRQSLGKNGIWISSELLPQLEFVSQLDQNRPNLLRTLNQNIPRHYSDDDYAVVHLQGRISEIYFYFLLILWGYSWFTMLC